MNARTSSAGFTLIEAIMVITITGIIAAVVSVFITKPVVGYVDSVKRAQLTDAADVALRRISRDIRLALPNSLRLKNASNTTVTSCAAGTTCYIEFIITKSGGRYRDAADGSTGGNVLDFTGTITNPGCATTPSPCFDILGSNTTTQVPNITNGDFLVVYNLGEGNAPADAYAGGNRTTLTLTAGTPYRATMASNVFAAQSPPLPSPSSRFQIVDQNQKVIRYGCVGGNLTRENNCAFSTTTSCDASPPLIATNATCAMTYSQNATGRNGLLYLQLTVADATSGESATLFQQIHVNNAP